MENSGDGKIISNSKKKILVIEDNIESQLIFKIYLREDYDVEIVDTGEKGLDKLQNCDYDLLVLDVHLPGKYDGMKVLMELKKLENKNSKIPTVVVTAYAIQGYKENFLSHGVHSFLTKPIDKNTLLAEIQKSLILN